MIRPLTERQAACLRLLSEPGAFAKHGGTRYWVRQANNNHIRSFPARTLWSLVDRGALFYVDDKFTISEAGRASLRDAPMHDQQERNA